MAQINVFRMERAHLDSTEGYLSQICDELNELVSDNNRILEMTDIVVVPNDAVYPWSTYKHQDGYDPELERLVNDVLEFQRIHHNTITVSLPITWVRREIETPEEEHWQLRFSGKVIANVYKDTAISCTPWAGYYSIHGGPEVYMGHFTSLQEAMEAIQEHLGRDDK